MVMVALSVKLFTATKKVTEVRKWHTAECERKQMSET